MSTAETAEKVETDSRTTFRIDPELMDWLRQYSRTNGQSMSFLLRKMISQFKAEAEARYAQQRKGK